MDRGGGSGVAGALRNWEDKGKKEERKNETPRDEDQELRRYEGQRNLSQESLHSESNHTPKPRKDMTHHHQYQRGKLPSPIPQKFTAENTQVTARMIDLEKRLGAQEQMNKFLVSEINNQEQDLDVIKKRYSKLEELERSQRSKLESSLKYASEENKYSISDLLSRVDMLEENLQKEEKQRVSYIDKIRNTEQNQKELVHLIKNIERQENSELSQMRELIHSKLGSDELTQVQQHEKSMALFNEVVRLGQQYESTSAHLQDLTTSLGNKLHIFESRIQKGETTLGALESMSGNEGGAFQAFAEKCNMRLSIIENAVQTVGSEQNMQKDGLIKVESNNIRSGEDVKVILSQIQTEFQQRMELKTGEIMSKVALETEERQRALEEVKYQLQIKDKLNIDQNQFDKDDLRDKYSQIDVLIRSEFTRRNDAVSNIQTALEAQIKNLHNSVRKEEIGRAQMELTLKSDITKLAEQLRTDYELFKNQQTELTEKMTEMIKLEVDARLNAERFPKLPLSQYFRENKALTQSMIKGVMQEIKLLKDGVEKQHKRFGKDLKEANSENSERAHFLSRYIDDEIKKLSEKSNSQIQKVKALCAKLTENVKDHLQNNEVARTHLETTVNASIVKMEGKLELFREEEGKNVEDIICEFLGEKMRVTIECKRIYEKLFSLKERFEKDYVQINNQIEKLNDNLKEMDENHISSHREQTAEMSEMMDRKMDSILEQLKSENNEIWLESLKLCEKEFSLAGVKHNLDLIPPQIYKKHEFKKHINQFGHKPPLPRPALDKGAGLPSKPHEQSHHEEEGKHTEPNPSEQEDQSEQNIEDDEQDDDQQDSPQDSDQ